MLRPQDVPGFAADAPRVEAPPEMRPATTEIPIATEPAAKPRHHYYHPGPYELSAAAAGAGIVTAGSLILARSQGAWGYWTVGRVTGFVVYGLLTLAVCLGIFLSLRWRTFSPAWLVAERLHPNLLLTAGSLLITHIAGFILIGLPVYSALIPFTADFRRIAIGLGILSAYLGVLLIVSTYVIRLIGYGVWRFLHYFGFVAWSLALVHGVASGHDSGSRLVLVYYAAGVLAVSGLLVVRLARYVASLRPPILQAVTSGAETRT